MLISPPPIRDKLLGTDDRLIREWQRWFIDTVKTIQATQILIYKQAAEPTIPSGYNYAIWVDTDDSDRSYFVYKRGDADQVKVELT